MKEERSLLPLLLLTSLLLPGILPLTSAPSSSFTSLSFSRMSKSTPTAPPCPSPCLLVLLVPPTTRKELLLLLFLFWLMLFSAATAVKAAPISSLIAARFAWASNPLAAAMPADCGRPGGWRGGEAWWWWWWRCVASRVPCVCPREDNQGGRASPTTTTDKKAAGQTEAGSTPLFQSSAGCRKRRWCPAGWWRCRWRC